MNNGPIYTERTAFPLLLPPKAFFDYIRLRYTALKKRETQVSRDPTQCRSMPKDMYRADVYGSMAADRCLSISFQIIEISMLKPFLAINQDLALITFKNKKPRHGLWYTEIAYRQERLGGDIINERAQEFSNSCLVWNQSIDSFIPLLDERCYEGGQGLPVMMISLRHFIIDNSYHFYVCQKRTKRGIKHSSLYRKRGYCFISSWRVW